MSYMPIKFVATPKAYGFSNGGPWTKSDQRIRKPILFGPQNTFNSNAYSSRNIEK